MATDQAALMALYDSAGGANWTNNTNWGSNEPLGTWYGVTTDANGGVTALNLNGNQLSGTIPPHWTTSLACRSCPLATTN